MACSMTQARRDVGRAVGRIATWSIWKARTRRGRRCQVEAESKATPRCATRQLTLFPALPHHHQPDNRALAPHPASALSIPSRHLNLPAIGHAIAASGDPTSRPAIPHGVRRANLHWAAAHHVVVPAAQILQDSVASRWRRVYRLRSLRASPCRAAPGRGCTPLGVCVWRSGNPATLRSRTGSESRSCARCVLLCAVQVLLAGLSTRSRSDGCRAVGPIFFLPAVRQCRFVDVCCGRPGSPHIGVS
ncbi:hypothetical protein FA95DRAFT_865179 [Auriscalpium vulgare]|uniref:Uncharacterized protein n=1 Tax=Auriscalpium vulgare TaxID=40419 RepID=A0ACB8RA92_9AGAM|nr:hypothetical protein FA95DRAFT_865179 [Auriscalpium vulgare]